MHECSDKLVVSMASLLSMSSITADAHICICLHVVWMALNRKLIISFHTEDSSTYTLASEQLTVIAKLGQSEINITRGYTATFLTDSFTLSENTSGDNKKREMQKLIYRLQ